MQAPQRCDHRAVRSMLQAAVQGASAGRLHQQAVPGVTLRIPLPVHDADDHAKLRDRWAFYAARPDDLAAAMARDKALAQAGRDARESRLRATWLYGEDAPDV